MFADSGDHVNLGRFLAPQLVKAAVEGRLPRGFNIERLPDPDADWSRQFQDLGLDPRSIKL